MCSPTRAATLTGRNNHFVGFGSIGEFPGPFPGYTASVPKTCAPFPRVLRDNGYATAGFGKWHLTPDRVQGAAGPHDRWPMGWGFGHFWGFLGAESGQYDPLITQDNTIIGVPEGTDGRGVLPARRPHRPRGDLAAHRPCPGPGQAVVRVLLHRLRARAAPRARGVEREVPGQVRPGLGPRCARRRSSARSSSASSRRTPSSRRGPTSSRPGTRCPTTSGSSTPARWRSTPASRRTPTPTSGACSTRSRRWASSTTPSSSTSSATTARASRAPSPAPSTR